MVTATMWLMVTVTRMAGDEVGKGEGGKGDGDGDEGGGQQSGNGDGGKRLVLILAGSLFYDFVSFQKKIVSIFLYLLSTNYLSYLSSVH